MNKKNKKRKKRLILKFKKFRDRTRKRDTKFDASSKSCGSGRGKKEISLSSTQNSIKFNEFCIKIYQRRVYYPPPEIVRVFLKIIRTREVQVLANARVWW